MDANIQTVQSMYDAFKRGDIGAIIAALTPDADWHSGGPKRDYPPFGPRHGTKGVQEFFRQVGESLDFQEFTPREFYANADKVVVIGYYAMVVKNTGRKIASDWCHIFTFQDGKVVNFREITDTLTIEDAYRD